MPCRSQVPECPSARSEMLDLRVGVPECPSARPLFFSWKEGYPSARVPKCPVRDVRLESGSARRPECRTTFFSWKEGSPSARVPKCPVGDVRLESGSARRPECPTTFLFPGRYGDGRLKRGSAHHCPNTRVPDPFLPRRDDIKLLHTSEKFISKKTKCPSARGARVPEASIPPLSSAISK